VFTHRQANATRPRFRGRALQLLRDSNRQLLNERQFLPCMSRRPFSSRIEIQRIGWLTRNGERSRTRVSLRCSPALFTIHSTFMVSPGVYSEREGARGLVMTTGCSRCGTSSARVGIHPAELAKRDIISPLTGRQQLSTAIFYARSARIGITAF